MDLVREVCGCAARDDAIEFCRVHKEAPQLLEYVQKLLGVTELNLDDLEPDTRALVQDVAAFVADLEQPPEV